MFSMFQSMKKQRNMPDFILLALILTLLVIGLMMVYSSSHVWADYKYGDPFFFLKRQLLFVSIGLLFMFVLTFVSYKIWKKYVMVILTLCFLFLVLVLVPGIGIVRGGAQSWIGIGAFSIQPSEFMKLGLIMFLAYYLEKHRFHIHTFKKGFFVPISLVFISFACIMLQPDLGTGVVLVITAVLMIFIAGSHLRYFIWLSILGLFGFVLLILSAPYRISRITSYLDPWADPRGDGFQIIQSLYALGPGKLMGVGFGNSIQKYFYLPEPQTDFIFAVVGEEFGFIGATFVILLFVTLSWRGIYIALMISDAFGRYVAFGIVGMMIVQVMINISVVIGLIPVTGITLPLLSYGGSSLTLTLCALGILLNISIYAKKKL